MASAQQPGAVGQVNPLLQSKITVPDPPAFMVPRDRLSTRLLSCGRDQVTVVTGPAGSGKTQAVAAWVRGGRDTDQVAWITLEEGDSTPAVFWTYVVESLRRVGVPLFPGRADPVPPDAVTRAFLIRLAAQLAGQPRPVT
ncbi:MAG TPA: hypothetical protein VES42_14840, partial [Pilimelia sp.]|nr:hypothetical protein [Pilimelia sp.]